MVCACGCGREIERTRPWQKFFEAHCRWRFWNAEHPRRPAKRTGAAHNALQRIPTRVYCRRHIEVGFVRKALALVLGANEHAAAASIVGGREMDVVVPGLRVRALVQDDGTGADVDVERVDGEADGNALDPDAGKDHVPRLPD